MFIQKKRVILMVSKCDCRNSEHFNYISKYPLKMSSKCYRGLPIEELILLLGPRLSMGSDCDQQINSILPLGSLPSVIDI